MVAPFARYQGSRSLVLAVCLSVPFLVTDCAGRKVSTSVQDQAAVAGQPKKIKSAAPPGPQVSSPQKRAPITGPPVTQPSPPAIEEVRVTEPDLATLPPPLTAAASGPPPAFPASQPAPPLPPPNREHVPVLPPPVAVPPIERGDVYFDVNEFRIRSDARTILEANAELLKAQPGVKLIIEGHCDERGSGDYNILLGERRAEAVKRHLQELGVSASRIQVTSFGKEKPSCRQRNDDCWQKNRRAHLVLKQQ
jgi:peptidoglycan-associated lipoprotein